MIKLTLFVKAFNNGHLKRVEELLQNQFEELEVDIKITANPTNKWVQAAIKGEDEAIAAAFVRKEIGVCPVGLDELEETSLRGVVSKVDDKREQLLIDVGIFEPKVVHATVSFDTLRAQLLASEQTTVKTIAEAYGIAEGLPVKVEIISSESENLKAELSSEQVVKLRAWQQSLLDRLIVLRANKELIISTLERTRLNRDVIDIEQLGFFEFSLTCKLGTDARGLVPLVGRYMRNTLFVVFNAKKAGAFLSQQY
jgi:hypothetical protein